MLYSNGTLQDIKDWWYGEDDSEITRLAKLFYIGDTLYQNHRNEISAQDAQARAEARAKKDKRSR